MNGASWTLRENVARECSNGYYEYADGIRARYVRVTGGELPYGQALRISGLRVFGNGEGPKPAQAEAAGARVDALDATITWKHIENAQGCMPIKAVQQFMLGTVLSNEQQARETLAAMKAAGYDGIELCGFMIHPIGFVVKLLTKAAGMPVGKGGNLDWHKLVQETGLQVVSLHTDLGSLERDAHAVAEEAKSFGTQHVGPRFCQL